jgi:hypothetical protein
MQAAPVCCWSGYWRTGTRAARPVSAQRAPRLFPEKKRASEWSSQSTDKPWKRQPSRRAIRGRQVDAKSMPSRSCENFLYRFKAARRAARAADRARSPSLPLALSLRRRQRRSAGAKGRETFGPLTDNSHRALSRGGVHAPAAELSKAGQNRRVAGGSFTPRLSQNRA